MTYNDLTKAEKAALLYWGSFLLSESMATYGPAIGPHERECNRKIRQIDAKLLNLGFPISESIIFDEDGAPLLQWEAFGDKVPFDYLEFIYTLASSTNQDEPTPYNTVTDFPIIIQFS